VSDDACCVGSVAGGGVHYVVVYYVYVDCDVVDVGGRDV